MVRQEEDLCARCNDSCYGEVVNVEGKIYHQYCFSCIKCKADLLETGYFIVDGELYCNDHYYNLNGTKCDGCGKYVEGEVITAFESCYHPECFGCSRCRKIFPPGVPIVFDGDGFVCEDCDNAIRKNDAPKQPIEEKKIEKIDEPKASDSTISNCAGCGNDIKSGQALLALEKQWHLWCFTCHKCGCLLAGEYMGRDGVPYCEQDYQSEFGVSCAGCGGYITGKVLQAGEKHYHPQCSRCAKCGQMFGEGEEMYLQGSEIWHPECSEEFQRENEEADNKWLAENDFTLQKSEDEPVGSSSPRSPRTLSGQLRVQTRLAPDSDTDLPNTSSSKQEDSIKRVPPPYGYNDRDNNESLPNGYNNHDRQASRSSESSLENKVSTWAPPSYTSSTTLKPVGFKSVKPPTPVQSTPSPITVLPSKSKESDEEDEPPPIPPPPTRTSSNAFREKYASGVYSAKPFNKQEPQTQTVKSHPLSYIESAAARKAANDNEATSTVPKRTTISISTRSINNSVSSANSDSKDEVDLNLSSSPTSKSYRKGVGYNKLQARKSFSDKQKPNGFGPPTEIDPDVKRKLANDTTYPYDILKTTSYKTPVDVQRAILEVYLNDREFYQVFQMTREKFYILPKWKQDDMKKKALLF